MRLVTWNCCGGALGVKGALVERLAADVVVVQECARPPDGDGRRLWFGDKPRRGIGVWAREGYRLEPVVGAPIVPRYAIPIQVTGERTFLLIAVWAMNEREFPYVQAAIRAMEVLRELIEQQPTVAMGDFNSNAIWNRKRPGARDHAYLVRLMDELGMVSAYHAFFGETHGEETRATWYMHWNETKRYHLDYCFVPKVWAAGLRAVEVGGFEAWARWSDHRPVIVDC